MYNNIKLSGAYRKFTKRGDPRCTLSLPENVYQELVALADFNKRTVKEEILARIIKTLELNDEFMATERLMRIATLKRFVYQDR